MTYDNTCPICKGKGDTPDPIIEGDLIECQFCFGRGFIDDDNTAALIIITRDAEKLERILTTNAALLEALIVAEGAVSFMAQATDADPEDYERKRIVDEAIRKATE